MLKPADILEDAFAGLSPKQFANLVEYVDAGKKFVCGKDADYFVRAGKG